jgi:hypothetical protein
LQTSHSKEVPKFTNISAGNNSMSKKLVDIQLDQKSSGNLFEIILKKRVFEYITLNN